MPDEVPPSTPPSTPPAGTTTPPVKPPEYASIPEKFHRPTLAESLSAWQEGHKSLEQTLHSKPPAEAPKPLTLASAPAVPDNADPETVLKAAGLDVAAVRAEYAAGSLSDATYKALDAKGINRVTANLAMKSDAAGQQLHTIKLQQSTARAVAQVGGEAQAQNLLAWAKTLPPEQQAVIEADLKNPDKVEQTVAALAFRRSQSSGTTGSVITAGTAGPGATGLSDEAYRHLVRRAGSGDRNAAIELTRHQSHILK